MPLQNRDSYENPHQQIMMIQDAARTSSFAQALRAAVRPSSVVVDIGSGSGILALIAAQAGARHVYAVERTSMARTISAAARQNGVADRITVLQADALMLSSRDFPLVPDLVVSEMLGHFASSEDLHAISGHVRGLFPRAQFLPARYRVVATPVWSQYFASLDGLTSVEGVDMSDLARRARATPTPRYVQSEEVVGTSALAPWIDVTAQLPGRYEWLIQAHGDFNALALTWQAELSDGCVFETHLQEGHCHWVPYLFPLPCPFRVAAPTRIAAEIATRDNVRPATWCWTIGSTGQSVTIDAQQQWPVANLQDLLDTLGLQTVLEKSTWGRIAAAPRSAVKAATPPGLRRALRRWLSGARP